MPSILEGAKATVKAELDAVAKRKLTAEVGSDGRLTGAISTTRRGWTLTAYVQALVTGPAKTTSAGLRVEKDF